MNGLILTSQFLPLLGFLLIFLSNGDEKKNRGDQLPV